MLRGGKKQFRKRTRSESSGDDDGVNLAKVQLIIEDQKSKNRESGVSAEEIAEAKEERLLDRNEVIDTKDSSKDNGFSDKFSSALLSDITSTDNEGLMKAYIESKLTELKGEAKATNIEKKTVIGVSSVPSGTDVSAEEILANPDLLYSIPEHINHKSILSHSAGDVGSGGVILGGVGIAEVSLPDDFAKRAARDTEKAAAEYLQKKLKND